MRRCWLLILLGVTAWGAEKFEPYRFGKETIQVAAVGPEGWLVSKDCQPDSKKGCLAFQAASKVKLGDRLTALRPGGYNPGSLLCRDVGGIVAVGRDSRGDEQSFCLFEKDRTLISTDSLILAARKN